MADTVGHPRALLELVIALEELMREVAYNEEHRYMLIPSTGQRIQTMILLIRRMRREAEAPGEFGGQPAPTIAATPGGDAARPSSELSDRGGSRSPEGVPVGDMHYVAHDGLVDGMFLNNPIRRCDQRTSRVPPKQVHASLRLCPHFRAPFQRDPHVEVGLDRYDCR